MKTKSVKKKNKEKKTVLFCFSLSSLHSLIFISCFSFTGSLARRNERSEKGVGVGAERRRTQSSSFARVVFFFSFLVYW